MRRTVLLLLAAAVAAGAGVYHTEVPLSQQHTEALAAWARERQRDFVSELRVEQPRLAAAVAAACRGVVHEEERWMCKRRGAAMARQLQQHAGQPVTQADADAHVARLAASEQGGVRVFVRGGRLAGWELVGASVAGRSARAAAVLGTMVEGARGGALQANFSFDVVVQFEKCTKGQAAFPSASDVACAGAAVVPVVGAERARWLRPTRGWKGWDDLRVSVDTVMQARVGVDDGAARPSHASTESADTWLEHRHLLVDAHDDATHWGGAAFATALRGPGVALLQGKANGYYADDAVAFAHYVPVNRGNTTKVVAALRERGGAAGRQIASTGAKWAAKHHTVRTSHRQWKLLYHLLDALWDSTPLPPLPAAHRHPLTCELCGGLAGITQHVTQAEGEQLWRRTCGNEGLGDALLPECTDLATHQALEHEEGPRATCYEPRPLHQLPEELTAPTAPPTIDQMRADALARWQRMRATDYMEVLKRRFPERAHIVRTVCSPVRTEGERWLCERRGLRMARRMQLYTRVSRKESDLIKAGMRADLPEGGFRVVIRNGEVHSWEHMGNDVVQPYLHVVLGKLQEGVRWGAMPRNASFDLIVLNGDAHSCFGSRASLPHEQPPFPVTKYTVPSSGCPNHIPLPTQEVLQWAQLRVTRPYKSWEELKNKAIFRGSINNVQRIQLAALSALDVHPLLDAGVQMRDADRSMCSDLIRKMFEEGVLPKANLAGRDRKKMCFPSNITGVKSARGLPLNADAVAEYKYVIAADGHGAVGRLLPQMAAPGVVLTMRNHAEMEPFFYQDLVPWVHHVPLSGKPGQMMDNVTATLDWLEANQDVARSIAEESSKWVEMHKPAKADQREWKMFYHFMMDIWTPTNSSSADSTKSPNTITASDARRVSIKSTKTKSITNTTAGNADGNIVKLSCATCNGLDDIGDKGNKDWKRELWHLTCGQHGVGTALFEEITDPAVAAYVKAQPASPQCVPEPIVWLPSGTSAGYLALDDALGLRLGKKAVALSKWAAQTVVTAAGSGTNGVSLDGNHRQTTAVTVEHAVCGAVQEREERSMCMRRAARMTRAMQKYSGLTHTNAQAAVDRLRNTGQPGMHLEVEQGQVTQWHHWGNDTALVPDIASVLEGIRRGIPAGSSFGLVIAFAPAMCPAAPADDSAYPIVWQDAACGNGVLLPRPVRDTQRPRPSTAAPAWGERTQHVAVVSVPGAASIFTQADPLHLQCKGLGSMAVPVEKVWGVASGAADVPREDRLAWSEGAQNSTRMARYALATPASVRCGQLAEQLMSGSVVLAAEELLNATYYQQDLVPWVHYVPISTSTNEAALNISDTLAWLRAHPRVAHQISDSARAFMLNHAGPASDDLQWRLFHNHMARAWSRSGILLFAPNAPDQSAYPVQLVALLFVCFLLWSGKRNNFRAVRLTASVLVLGLFLALW